MASLVGETVAKNYERALMETAFGTRKLSYFTVSLTGVHTNFWSPGSSYAKAIQGIQTIAEIYSVGYPSNDRFVVAVAFDTTVGSVDPWPTGFAWGATPSAPGRPSAASRQNRNSYLESAINDATGGECYVYNAVFEGGSFTYDC
jgi:hypothetical protein